MNTSNIKRYAPKARTAFIAAMTKRAALFGIRESSIPSMGIEPLEQKGDLALIGDRPFPASIIRPRAALVKKVEQIGFAQAMEQAAYSWFNRLCAIRYMELKGYLDHGRRVLSHPDQPGSFQILDDCLDIDLEGLDKQRIAELKLDGTKDEELYRELLLAQCHALHQAMPFLFEAVDDATELLLPDNLTKTDSLIRELISAIPDEDWHDVEIIGWLYQFYISEKKDQVIGKVVKSEDIPAATQLFTPNWIVQYLVQNSVGRQWLQTYPDSSLKAEMPYYVESVEQTPEVQTQLAAIIPESIDPLSIKVLDPACGSGHILVEAYKVLKAIYKERGFRIRDIPQLILENNLFGLDIDDRAGQLAGFALMMLAREDDRRLFNRLAENSIKLNVLSLQESSQLDLESLWQALNLTNDWQRGQSQRLFESELADLSSNSADNRYRLLKNTLARFTQAKTFGSLIRVPEEDADPLTDLLVQLQQLAREGDVMQKPAAELLIPFVQQAWVLAQRYDAVVANPPYMGTNGMCLDLKEFAKKHFPDAKSDLFSCFIEHGYYLAKKSKFISMITMQNWMFLSSYQQLRERMLDERTICNMAHIGFNSFPTLNSKIALATAFTIINESLPDYLGLFIDLNSSAQAADKDLVFRGRGPDLCFKISASEFKRIPGSPLAYWASEKLVAAFEANPELSSLLSTAQGMKTLDNDRFIRDWPEVPIDKTGALPGARRAQAKWFPINHGGEYRKWFGNNESVINWKSDGAEIKSLAVEKYNSVTRTVTGMGHYFKPGITWTSIGILFGARSFPEGFIFTNAGMCAFGDDDALKTAGCLLNSNSATLFLAFMSPTLNFGPNQVKQIPFPISINSENCIYVFDSLTSLAKADWDAYERSWDFRKNPLLDFAKNSIPSIEASYKGWIETNKERITKMKELEEKNNELFIEAFGLGEELSPEVTLDRVTLTINPAYRYGGNTTESALWERFRDDTMREFLSYAIGCILGRYSLDREGLVYAHAGNQGFTELVAEGAYQTFHADSDGILPLSDQEWFTDDATNRFREFVRTIWSDEHLQENLDFVVESLFLYAIKPKRGESAMDTIRRYLSNQFFKDHLKTYKKRPIYWLFSSGKHKAFECLVYLHRYNEGTLARMRTEYVIPLTAKLNTYANKLEQDIDASTSTAEKKALEKQLATLHNQQAELATFDEKLRHYADQRISLDLDDGVKVNYGKFGDLLVEVKAVTGEKGD